MRGTGSVTLRLLTHFAALLLAAPLFAETLTLEGQITLQSDEPRFGGLSGLDVLDNDQILMVSDKGTIWRGHIARDQEGKLAGVENLEMRPILTSKGEAVDEFNIDAEGLDHDDGGNLYISFESNTRVSRFAAWDAPAELIPSAEAFGGFGFNSGPEAMCIGEDQEIWLAPERSGALDRPFPLFQFDGHGWRQDIGIPRRPPYLLVGMDYDPANKRLYILERDLFLATQFRIRIRAFDYTPTGLENEETLWENKSGQYGNLEGISYYERDGARHLMLVTDDNFISLFATHLLEMRIND